MSQVKISGDRSALYGNSGNSDSDRLDDSRGLREQFSDAVGELGAVAGPVVNAIALEGDGRGVRAGIVGSDDFDRAAIAGAVLFDHNDAVVGLLPRSNARETNHQHWAKPFENEYVKNRWDLL
jgi:hypothetical protein